MSLFCLVKMMKKNFIFLVLVVLIIGTFSVFGVNAANGDENLGVANQGNFNDMDPALMPKPILYQEVRGERISSGEHNFGQGKKVMIERKQNRIEIRSGEFVANCEDCNMTEERDGERTKFFMQKSNGMNSEIKIMPDQASEVALARLKLRDCENCLIELKEIGKNDRAKMAYKIRTKRHAKFLGVFNSEMNVEAEVDAETGEVLKIRKPWWGFMASSKEELAE